MPSRTAVCIIVALVILPLGLLAESPPIDEHVTFPGEWLLAVEKSKSVFFQDENLTEPQRSVKNYMIMVGERKTYWYVLFDPKPDGGPRHMDCEKNSLGKTRNYHVNKSDASIKRVDNCD